MNRFLSMTRDTVGKGLLLLLALLPLPAASAAGGAAASHIDVSLVSEADTIAPGTPFLAAVRLEPEPGWHTYWRNPGDTGLPTRIDWTLSRGGQAGPIQWPYPERIDYQGLINYGYHGETLLLTRITPPADLRPGESYPLRATVHWLICKDICIPGSSDVATTLSVGSGIVPGPWADRIAESRQRLPQRLDTGAARFHLDDNLVVALPDAAKLVGAGEEVEFFPVDPDIVANGVEPRFAYRDGNLLVQTGRSTDFKGPPPETLDGLLVVGRGDSGRAYRFSGRASQEPIAFSQSNRHIDAGLLYILLLAFVGGFILNLMPCVFPVLSIKVLSLIKSGTHDRRQRRRHGFAYTAGVLASILVFAAVLLGLRAAGESVGWGFQLQSPGFVAVLIYILFVMGLSLSGLIEIGTSLTRAGNLLRHHGLAGSFFNGALATVVATPCTVPFMATAVGFAMTQTALTAVAVFAVLGLGLASPFLLLALFPALADRLPKPGQWMETLKQLLAFPLYFTVIWLLWVLDRQAGSHVQALVLTGMALLALALWLWRLARRARRPLWLRGTALAVMLAAVALLPGLLAPATVRDPVRAAASEYGLPVVDYSEAGIRRALADNRPVFVNITADWCITCKVNERVTLENETVQRSFRNRNVVYMVGDWTNGDEHLSRVLARFDRSGVPLYLLYRPGSPEPAILPQLLTPATVIEALED